MNALSVPWRNAQARGQPCRCDKTRVRLAHLILTSVNRQTAFSEVSFIRERRAHGVCRGHRDGYGGEDGRESMTEGLQRVVSWQDIWAFRQYLCSDLLAFTRIYSNDVVEFIDVRRIVGGVPIEVRHCRTAMPHNRTAFSEESFVTSSRERHGTWCGDRKRRPCVSYELPAQTGGAAGARRRAAGRRSSSWIQWGACGGISSLRTTARRGAIPIQCADRIVSHKWATYFEASIPSFSRKVNRRVPVVRRHPAGIWSAFLLQTYRYLHRHLLRFTAVYAHSFETMSLNSLMLRAFTPFFSRVRHDTSCGSAVRHCRIASTRRKAVGARGN